MSEEDLKGVPFSIGHDESSLKLIELPDELLDMLQSDHPPSLQIKSKGPLGSETQSFAVLCSDEKTYQLRQQQTSNSLFIVKPRSTTLEDGTPAEGISVIASCGATLELTLSKDSAEPYLRELLRYWDGENMNEMEIDNRSKENIYDDIPLSTSEIEQGWETLCAFEHSNVCYIPTNTYLFTAWKSIISAAFADNIDTADHTQDATLWRAVSDEGIPEELFLVILSHSKKTNGSIWIARLLLESLSNQVISREEFMISLKDVLPRNMGFPDTFDAFKEFADLSDPTSISFKQNSNRANASIHSGVQSSKRTWHERFKKKR